MLRIEVDLKDFKKRMRDAESEWRRSGRQMALAGAELTRNVTLPILGLGAAAIKSFADLERMEVGLTAITGSAAQARKEMEAIRKIALAPGIGYTQALEANTQLRAMGETAEFTQAALMAFARATAFSGGTAENFSHAMVQFRQTLGTGLLDVKSLRIIKEQIPGTITVMRELFGTADEEAIRATVSAREFWERMIEGMSKLPPVAETTANAFDNFYTEVRLAFAELGRAIVTSTGFNEVLGNLAETVTDAAHWFAELGTGTQKLIIKSALLVAAVGPVLKIFGSMKILISQVFAALGNLAFMFGLASGSAGRFVKNMRFMAAAEKTGIFLISAAVWEINKGINSWGDNLNAFQQAIKAIWKANPIVWLADYSDFVLKQVEKIFGKTEEAVKELERGFALGTLGLGSGYKTDGIPGLPKPERVGGKKKSTDGTTRLVSAPWLQTPELNEVGGVEGLSALVEQMEHAQKVAPRLVESFNLLRSSIDFADEGWKNIRPNIEAARKEIQKAFEEHETLVAQVEWATDKMVGFFEQMFQGIIEGTKSFSEIIRDILAGLLKRVLALIAAWLVLLAVSGGTGKIAGIAKDIIKGGIGSFLGKGLGVPGFAEGGIVSGPTPALVGEYPGARANPEVIAPLDKLKSLMGNMGGGWMNGQIVGRIAGQDLILIWEQAQFNRAQLGGAVSFTLGR